MSSDENMSDVSDVELEFDALISGEKCNEDKTQLLIFKEISAKEKGFSDAIKNCDDQEDHSFLKELEYIVGESDKKYAAEASNDDTRSSNELSQEGNISITDLLKSRLQMYEAALEHAKQLGDSPRVRRIARGRKCIYDLLNQCNGGNVIKLEDIPPKLVANKHVEHDSETVIAKRNVTEEQDANLTMLHSRKNEYKIAALNSKRAGDMEIALQFFKIVKKFENVIESLEAGEYVDLSDMPPPPSDLNEFLKKKIEPAEEILDEKSTNFPKDEQPNLLHSLLQRLEVYKNAEVVAKNEKNNSKVRRYNRIVKQYEEAIKSHKCGKHLQLDELPIPPGFGPLIINNETESEIISLNSRTKISSEIIDEVSDKPVCSKNNEQNLIEKEHLSNIPPKTTAKTQLLSLLERQKEFKSAAIVAKKSGNLVEAKEYLKLYKTFDGVLSASRAGLPVDMTTVPIPPSQRANLENAFLLISNSKMDVREDLTDISFRLEEQLCKQLLMCKDRRDHFKIIGDMHEMYRFENLGLSVKQQLDFLRYNLREKLSIPNFHYENKSFDIAHCNTDLTVNEIEISVIRGIGYNVPNPKDIDTYVKLEFPYPQNDHFKSRTALARNTDSPKYGEIYKIEFQRNSRQCQRMFKIKSVKFEIFSKGGFLRSDILIGTVNVKLQPLQTKCDIHDCFDLMIGKKKIGGTIEIKIRIREPISVKEIEHITERWAIIDL